MGSEMCIRDSSIAAAQAAPALSYPFQASAHPKPDCPSGRPVSPLLYTAPIESASNSPSVRRTHSTFFFIFSFYSIFFAFWDIYFGNSLDNPIKSCKIDSRGFCGFSFPDNEISGMRVLGSYPLLIRFLPLSLFGLYINKLFFNPSRC